ncbi:hypothetical protein [Wolbachia endosymbiont of Drosophila innubila]|nr:hypothetical protein [Wolbachia endosymbiont of Drosophila innubila]
MPEKIGEFIEQDVNANKQEILMSILAERTKKTEILQHNTTKFIRRF